MRMVILMRMRMLMRMLGGFLAAREGVRWRAWRGECGEGGRGGGRGGGGEEEEEESDGESEDEAPAPLAAAEARRAVAEEGLALVRSGNASGYLGVGVYDVWRHVRGSAEEQPPRESRDLSLGTFVT